MPHFVSDFMRNAFDNCSSCSGSVRLWGWHWLSQLRTHPDFGSGGFHLTFPAWFMLWSQPVDCGLKNNLGAWTVCMLGFADLKIFKLRMLQCLWVDQCVLADGNYQNSRCITPASFPMELKHFNAFGAKLGKNSRRRSQAVQCGRLCILTWFQLTWGGYSMRCAPCCFHDFNLPLTISSWATTKIV